MVPYFRYVYMVHKNVLPFTNSFETTVRVSYSFSLCVLTSCQNKFSKLFHTTEPQALQMSDLIKIFKCYV